MTMTVHDEVVHRIGFVRLVINSKRNERVSRAAVDGGSGRQDKVYIIDVGQVYAFFKTVDYPVSITLIRRTEQRREVGR